jgi:wyosine [tRNA(Phe)-imidazoG37] synthetase (radical SAM superfamily)
MVLKRNQYILLILLEVEVVAGMAVIAFGPIPSRRLGRSLGINNIPPKTCTYSCVYCQLGETSVMTVKRCCFYKPEDVLRSVEVKVHEAISKNEGINYLTFVPDGEPTLDVNIGREITLLKRIGIPIAVITNASLLWLDEVREDLLKADLVSLKVDAVSRNLWRSINRPCRDLELDKVLDGIERFAKTFKGVIVSETMLIDGVKYNGELMEIAEFLGGLAKLDKAYIAIPTRPPAERWVKPAREEVLNKAFQIFSKKLGSSKVEYLVGYEGNAFTSTGNVKEDLLAITAVHPMREEAVMELLKKANASQQIINELLRSGEIVRLEYEGNIYYMRKLTKNTFPTSG